MQDGSCEVASWLGGKPPRKSLVVLPQQPRMMCVFFSFCNLGRKQLCFENLWMPLEVCLTVTSWREAVPFQCDTCQEEKKPDPLMISSLEKIQAACSLTLKS